MAQRESSMKKLILASGSPRRRTLLENYGFDITVIKPEFNENTVAESDPGALVAALALGKNRAVRMRCDASLKESAVFLSPDTVVSIGGKILGKPIGSEDAFHMLRLLSGSTHTVYTGVCISSVCGESCFTEKTDVTFYALSDTQIRRYIDSGAPFDKAGGYGIQDDMGIGFIESVHGELSNVIGLPMRRTVLELQKLQGDII